MAKKSCATCGLKVAEEDIECPQCEGTLTFIEVPKKRETALKKKAPSKKGNK